MTDDLLAELVRFLVHQPTATERLAAIHVDDGSGRCRACEIGGQCGSRRWPCLLFVAAGLAADRPPGGLSALGNAAGRGPAAAGPGT